jgi:hypothetical protein
MKLINRIKLSSYRKFQIVFFTICILAVIYFWRDTNDKKRQMWANARYTIAVTNGTTHGLKTTLPFVGFYYYVNGMKFNSSYNIDLKEYPIQTEGGRYLVVFSSKDSKFCEFQYNCPVPDSIKDSPDEGWIKPPFNCNVHENDKLLDVKTP